MYHTYVYRERVGKEKPASSDYKERSKRTLYLCCPKEIPEDTVLSVVLQYNVMYSTCFSVNYMPGVHHVHTTQTCKLSEEYVYHMKYVYCMAVIPPSGSELVGSCCIKGLSIYVCVL